MSIFRFGTKAFATGAALAAAIDELRGSDPEVKSIAAIVASGTGPVRAWRYHPSTPAFPKWLWAKFDDGCVILIDGTDSINQVVGQLGGYYGGAFSSWTDPANGYYETWGQAIGEQYISENPYGGTTTYLAGWSMGGAVCMYLGEWLKRQNYALYQGRVVTFGSPRPGGLSKKIQLEGAQEIQRWMNSDDPVALVPLRAGDFPILIPIYGVRGCVRAGYFVQAGDGTELLADGTYEDVELPTQANASVTGSLVNWLVNLTGRGEYQHNIVTYRQRLEALAARFVEPEASVPMNVDGPAVATNGMIQAIQNQQAQTIFNREHSQNAVAVQIPVERRFKAVRSGRVWYVQFNQQLVFTCGSKKKARQVARVGNAFLESMQPTAAVDTASFPDLFRDYLVSAGKTDAGFAPVMSSKV